MVPDNPVPLSHDVQGIVSDGAVKWGKQLGEIGVNDKGSEGVSPSDLQEYHREYGSMRRVVGLGMDRGGRGHRGVGAVANVGICMETEVNYFRVHFNTTNIRYVYWDRVDAGVQ